MPNVKLKLLCSTFPYYHEICGGFEVVMEGLGEVRCNVVIWVSHSGEEEC